jgi:hypothetical protein
MLDRLARQVASLSISMRWAGMAEPARQRRASVSTSARASAAISTASSA